MRHRCGNKKLGKPTDQRIALLRALALGLITHKKIETTDTRAKEAKKYVEKLVTLARRGDLHSRRQALMALPNAPAISELFTYMASHDVARTSGFLRLTKLGFRRGDAAPVTLVEFIQ